MRLPFVLLTVMAATASMAQGPCDALAAANARQQEELIRQRLELDRMLMDMEEVRFQVAKARKEAEVLQRVMKSYIATIDSLQRENMRLQEAVKR